MFKRVSKALIVASILTAPAVVTAENMPAKASVESKTAVKSDSLEAALKLVNEMGMESSYTKTINLLTNNLIKRVPQLATAKDKIIDFYQKYIGWSVIKNDIANIYAKHFTKEELNDLLKFYQSPTGKKAIKEMPSIMMESRELGMKKVATHMGELQKIIESVMKKEKEAQKK